MIYDISPEIDPALAVWPVPRRPTRIDAALRGSARRRVVDSALGRSGLLMGAWLGVIVIAGAGAPGLALLAVLAFPVTVVFQRYVPAT